MAWSQLWLDYKPLLKKENSRYLSKIYCNEKTPMLENAIEELKLFSKKAFEIQPSIVYESEIAETGIVLRKVAGDETESYTLCEKDGKITVKSAGDSGILYGVFDIIRRMMQEENLKGLYVKETPDCRYRMLDHWDNIDGTIERGYSGNSFFFDHDEILIDQRTQDYARLIASIGINQVAINNVNVKGNAGLFITDRYLPQLKKMAEIFKGYGVSLYLCIDFAAPLSLGELKTADPLDENVRQWWEKCATHIYQEIPQFGGFLVKADSEGRPGPFYYGRDHADGANMLAEALEPYGGTVIWRCFVYNCRQDWRDPTVDRAKAAYDTFMPVDGKFASNVILQIKNGPMDFQVREPVSPLFGGLTATNQMLEVQIAQEYTGHQIDVCYLVPMWKEILSFHTYCKDEDTVSDIVSERTFKNLKCGMAAVANTGNDENWTGNDLAAANLYGFGRLAWNNGLSAEKIAEQWIACTFGNNPVVNEKIQKILMMSWPAYENYTTPYGIGWMVTPHTHYGPSVDGYEYDAWGTYHKANAKAIGVERGTSGTGYVSQYRKQNADRYNDISTCPEELVLFFHRVSYDHKMKNGQTLLQNIYDRHFKGVEQVEKMMEMWKELKEIIPETVYERVWERFNLQYKNSRDWRDIVNTYFYRMTLVQDRMGRKIYE